MYDSLKTVVSFGFLPCYLAVWAINPISLKQTINAGDNNVPNDVLHAETVVSAVWGC